MSDRPTTPLKIEIRREAFSDYFELYLEDGSVEELEPDQTREWFRVRGANMFELEKVLDYVWNFHEATINIRAFTRPDPIRSSYLPDI